MRIFLTGILLLALFGCTGGGSDSNNCENRVFIHWFTNWDSEIVEILQPNEYFEMRLEFVVCDANLERLCGYFYLENDEEFVGPVYCYDLEPSSVGITLFWPEGIPSDGWAEVWIENMDGSVSPVYSVFLDVEE